MYLASGHPPGNLMELKGDYLEPDPGKVTLQIRGGRLPAVQALFHAAIGQCADADRGNGGNDVFSEHLMGVERGGGEAPEGRRKEKTMQEG